MMKCDIFIGAIHTIWITVANPIENKFHFNNYFHSPVEAEELIFVSRNSPFSWNAL